MKRLLLSFFVAASLIGTPRLARAGGDLDLEGDDDDKKTDEKKEEGYGEYKPPVATIKAHAYTLEECLALVDRNHPSIWAARARLAVVHAQLDEAKWTPFFQWSASSNIGVIPPLGGTPMYNSTPSSWLQSNYTSNLAPFFQVSVNGAIPLYTFGKIENIKLAAEGQVRASEWDLEKFRQLARMDVRRAYFGLMLARDAKYLVDDVLTRLDKALNGIRKRLAKGDTSIEEADKLRMELYRDEVLARASEATKGERIAMAGLRFLTGVQTDFDIPDEPLKRPDTPIGPVVRYLAAARIYRPEVNQARAAVAARAAYANYQRSRLYPDIGLGLGASYNYSENAVRQNTAWVGDPFNGFGPYAAIGIRWNLDLLPQQARIAQAEAQLEETRALQRLALGGIAVEVETAYAAVLDAKTREESWDQAEHRSRKWISMVQDAIDLGTKDERSMIEPLRFYVNARANHIYALMELNVQMSELARVSGWDAAAPTGR